MAPGHPAWIPGSNGFELTNSRQLAAAHLAEAGQHLTRITAGKLHGVFPQPVKAVGEAGHGPAIVAVILGTAGEQVATELFQGAFQLLVTCKIQRTETVDERREAVEGSLVDTVLGSVDGGQNLCGKSGCLLTHGGNAFADNLTGPPATGERKPATVPARKWMANEITPRRTYMAARKFHRAVMPGTDFKEWLEVVSAKHPGDFGISKTGDPTISLVRARQIAFLTTGAMCKNAMEIIQSVEKGGAEESGAMINARFDDLANETYVSSASVKHGAEWSDNGDNEASTLPSPKSP